MKIAYLSSSIIPSQKANSIQVMKMCNAFSESGHKVILFAKCSQENYSLEEIQKFYGINNLFNIISIPSSNIRLLGGIEYGFRIYNKIKRLNIDPDLLYGRNLYALIACLKLNKPIIYESHSAPIIGKKQLEKYLFSRQQFKRLIVINKALYNYYINNFKILKKNPNKILLASDSADIYEYSQQQSLYLKKDNHKPLIGYAGSLYPGKGIERIIEIAKIMPDCNFIIAGGSKTKIEEIKNKNYINNISFTGYIKPSKIQEFLSNCDILLAPYSNKVYSEYIQKNDISDWMSPLKIFEYMASKKPIIASNLPSLKEILEDKKTALLVDSKDTLAWKKSIEKILCKPEIAKKISENAFSLLKNNYTWKIRAKKVLDNLTFENISSSTNLNQASKAIILHIIGDLNLGGTERTMLKILPKLNNNHFEHQILTLFDLGCLAKDFQEAGIKVNCLNLSRSIIDFSNIKSIVKLIKRINIIKPSLIHTWLYHSNNLINILSPTLPQIPIINSIRHEDPKSGSLKTQISAIIGTILSNLKNNITIFCSESSKIKHLKMGYNPKKSLVIPNGFVIPDIDKEKSKTNLRQKLNISENSKIALIVGRYCKEKDYPTLLKAIKITIEKNPNIVFLLCGKGLENQNKELTNRIKQLRIENTIYLLGQQSNIEQIMASSDFLILSSNSESFPNVIAESMSVKTSCIATKVGETKNIIGDTGFIVESGNPQELANAILMFSNYDKQKLHILGEKAQSRIRNKYNLEKTINMYELIYSIFPS